MTLNPTHKAGPKDKIENYRPISKLCTISKVFEKLILEQLLKLAKDARIDLTGESQHGFKQYDWQSMAWTQPRHLQSKM